MGQPASSAVPRTRNLSDRLFLRDRHLRIVSGRPEEQHDPRCPLRRLRHLRSVQVL